MRAQANLQATHLSLASTLTQLGTNQVSMNASGCRDSLLQRAVSKNMEENRAAYDFNDLQVELEGDFWQNSNPTGDISELATWSGFEQTPSMCCDRICDSQSTEDFSTLLFSSGGNRWTSTRSSDSESSDNTSTLLDELLLERTPAALSSPQSTLRALPRSSKDSAPDLRRETRQREQKEKRRQQNRIAQQRFREGREAKMKEAQEKILLLETRLKFLIERNRILEREWLRMKMEVNRLHLDHNT